MERKFHFTFTAAYNSDRSVLFDHWPIAKYSLRIASFAYTTCIWQLTSPLGGRRWNVAITFGTEIDWYGYPRVKKKLKKCSFCSTEYTNVTDGRTDGQTDGRTDIAWRHRPRLHSIVRQKHRARAWVVRWFNSRPTVPRGTVRLLLKHRAASLRQQSLLCCKIANK